MSSVLDRSAYLGDGRRIVYTEAPNPTVLAALQKEHPQLGLRFLPIHKQWWVVWYWDADDPRRRHRQTLGLPQNPDAHSLIGPLPDDCSPDEAAAYVRNHYQLQPTTDDVARHIAKVQSANDAREQGIMDAALADVMNRVELSAKGLKEQFSEDADETTEIGERVELSPAELREIRERMREESDS